MEHVETPTLLGLGTLATRAHDLLDFAGHPIAEDKLVRHVFGLTGMRETGFWRSQLARLLAEHDIFAQLPDGTWALAAWQQAMDTLRALTYVVVDVETTGLNPHTQSIIEIAALRCRGSAAVESFSTLVDPGRPIPPFIRRFTGIHDDMVAGAPDAAAAVASFLRFAAADLLVGHNVRFDLNFIGEAAQRHLGRSIANESIDTIALGTLLVPGLRRPSLDRLAAALGLAAPQRHRASADTELTARAFWRLLDRAEARGIVTLGRLRAEMGGERPARAAGYIAGYTTGRLAGHTAGYTAGYTAVRPAKRTGKTLLDPTLRQNLPTTPGVYLMKDERGEIIYVGKAKNLRERVSSYYAQPLGYRRKTDGLLESVRTLETINTGTELQALILEDRLIKQYQPRFNIQQRNYEHYPFIKIDVQNAYPRIQGTREIAADGARYFGPYRSGKAVKTMIMLVQNLFPIRTCTRRLKADQAAAGKAQRGSLCLRYAMGRCLGPCHGDVTPQRYGEMVGQVCDFLGGNHDDLIASVETELRRAADNLRFERAAKLRDLLRDARRVLVAQQLLSGAVERHNLLIVYPSSEEGHAEVFGIRHGRLYEELRLNARRPLRELRRDLRALCARLLASAEPPAMIQQHEVDSINIIARWVYRHSDERSFVPLRGKPAATVSEALDLVRACRETAAAVNVVNVAGDIDGDGDIKGDIVMQMQDNWSLIGEG